jgi:hypothetical protein
MIQVPTDPLAVFSVMSGRSPAKASDRLRSFGRKLDRVQAQHLLVTPLDIMAVNLKTLDSSTL